jgi:hypothetical protein
MQTTKPTIEHPVPTYLADGAPILDNPIYRLDSKGDRFYYTMDDQGEPEFHLSVTSLIGRTLKTSTFLQKWRADIGWDEANEFMNERAAYGTTMHIICAEYLMGNPLDFESDYIENSLRSQAEKDGVEFSYAWIDDLKHDLIAFAQWVKDYQVKPFMIEQVVAAGGIGGAIDLVCELTITEKGHYGETYATGARKGEPKESKQERRVLALVDFKSGRKAFYESHEIQLGMYARLYADLFPDDPIEKLYNWSPKDWRTTPGYNFKDQTGAESQGKIKHLVGLAWYKGKPEPGDITIYTGELALGKWETSNYETYTAAEWVIENHKEKKA